MRGKIHFDEKWLNFVKLGWQILATIFVLVSALWGLYRFMEVIPDLIVEDSYSRLALGIGSLLCLSLVIIAFITSCVAFITPVITVSKGSRKFWDLIKETRFSLYCYGGTELDYRKYVRKPDDTAFKTLVEIPANPTEEPGDNNGSLYRFPGAPLIGEGIGCIVTDEKNILISCAEKKQIKNVICIQGCPEGGRGLLRCIVSLIGLFSQNASNASPEQPKGERKHANKQHRDTAFISALCRASCRRKLLEVLTPLAVIIICAGLVILAGGRSTIRLWFDVAVLSAGSIGLIFILLGYNKRITTIEVLTEEKKVTERLFDSLTDARNSLHYWGGIGFVGDSKGWRRELEVKMKNPDFTVKRFINLPIQSPGKIDDWIHAAGDENEKKEIIEKYTTWLEVHAKHAPDEKDSGSKNYKCFHYDGAPAWKYGIHFTIFDRKEVVILYPSSGMYKNAIFLRDPKAAGALVDYIESVEDVRRRLNKKDFQAAAKHIKAAEKNT